MQFPSDEELFGLIPKRNSKHLAGNIDPDTFDPKKETLADAYIQGLSSAVETMPTQHHTKKVTFLSWADYEPYDWSHETDMYINKVRTHAFQYIDSYIEGHLNRTNGYIGTFPPFSHKIGKCNNKEIIYSQVNVKDYHYVLPQYIQDLQYTYNKLNPDARTNIKKYRWYTVAAAFMVLAYYLTITLLRPVIANLNTILIDVIALVMSLAGAWIPYKGFSDGKDVLSFPKGGILWLVLMCLNSIGLMYMSDPEWHESIFRYVTYAIVLYAVIIFLLLLIQLIINESSLRKFTRTQQPQLEAKFTELMNKNGVKLHRYIRLRLLWCHFEDASCPSWLEKLQERLDLYAREYDRISAKNRK